MGSVIIETMIQDADGLVEVPLIKQYDLRTHMFDYMKDAMEKELWDGRTTVRISTLAKSIISLVDSKYNIGSKIKTTTSIMYIGCFNMINNLDKEQWNKFIDNSASLDFGTISVCDYIGTDAHKTYYDNKFALTSIGYKWVDNLNTIWPVADKKQIIYHMYNDHRLGKMFDIVTDRMGFSIKEAANMFALYATKDSDIFGKGGTSIQHLERIDKLMKFNNQIINDGIKSFNDSFIKYD